MIIKPFLTDEHKKTRTQWAKDNINRNWSEVIFSDEASFWLSKGAVRCWHEKGERKIMRIVKDIARKFTYGLV